MKVVTPQEMARIETKAIQEGASGEAFMEKAGSGLAEAIEDFLVHHHAYGTIVLICGKGNNGGDAYTAGRILIEKGYTVEARQLYPLDAGSPLLRQQSERFAKVGGKIKVVSQASELHLPSHGLIIDGIFGTGFSQEIEGHIAECIDHCNRSPLAKLAIDIPSGLDGLTGMPSPIAIDASQTFYLGQPKTGFFLGHGWNFVGNLKEIPFGLDSRYEHEMNASFLLMQEIKAKQLLPKIQRNRHKYNAGLVVGWAGSQEMPGAAVLASLAALRAGSGLVRLFSTKEVWDSSYSCPSELLRGYYKEGNLRLIQQSFEKAKSLFVGPGLGREKEVEKDFYKLLEEPHPPCVLDADALYFLSLEKEKFIPSQSLLTPHHGEMARLLGQEQAPSPITMEWVRQCQTFTEKKNVTTLLKGAPTFIFHPQCLPVIISTGDPGMATAGSGDVLTGILAGLMAQGLSAQHAAQLGAYLHGLSGQIGASQLTSYSLIASDLILHLPKAFAHLLQ